MLLTGNFSNNPPTSASVADAMKFLMILYSTCIGSFWREVTIIGVLDFETRKNIRLLWCVLLVMRCRIHLNIHG